MVPNRAITKRICQALRDDQPMDLACTAVGVDAPTLKRWLALGEAAYRECEEEDPHCRFFEAFIKALEYADQAVEANRRKPSQPEPELPPRPRAEPRRTEDDRVSEAPPLAWMVVEEAPIEIVIGSRPTWVYETPPDSTPVRSAEPARPTEPLETPSEETPSSQADIEDGEPRRDPTLGEVVEALVFLAITLIVLATIVAMILAVVPVALAGFTWIASLRLALGLAYRWRAGILILQGETTIGLPIRAPITWTAFEWRPRFARLASMDRTSGSVSLAGRLRPQRE